MPNQFVILTQRSLYGFSSKKKKRGFSVQFLAKFESEGRDVFIEYIQFVACVAKYSQYC